LRGLWGHPQARRRLHEALARPVHAYLFAGPAGTGKFTAARAFAQGLVCEATVCDPETGLLDACGACPTCVATQRDQHPDVRIWTRGETDKTFKVELVRELIQAVGRKPFSAARQVHILPDLDSLTLAGANALLKTLEEPPPTSTLLLLTRDPEQLLPTLISRCQLIRFGLTPAAEIVRALVSHRGISSDLAEAVAGYAEGRMGVALASAAHGDTARLPGQEWPMPDQMWSWADTQAGKPADAQLACLNDLLRQAREQAVATALSHQSASFWLACAKAVEQAREALQRHANAKLVFDRLASRLNGNDTQRV